MVTAKQDATRTWSRYTSWLLKKLLLQLIVGGLILAALTVILVRQFRHEPVYQGRTLSAWATDLRSGDPQTHDRAMEALRSSPDSVEFLANRILAGPGPVQRVGEFVGGYLPTVVKRPFRAIYDPGRQLLDKHLAAITLQQLGTNAQPAIPALGKMLHDSNVLLASSAGRALGQMGAPAVPVLISALDDPDYNVRSAACSALATLNTNAAPAVPRLCEILQHETGAILPYAADTLFQIRAPAVAPVTALLSSTNSETRRWAAYVLGRIGPDAEPSIPQLVAATKDTAHKVQLAAVQALGFVSLTSKAAADTLLHTLDDPDPDLRATALAAMLNRPFLVRLNEPRIAALLSDESPEVRSRAAQALERAGLNASSVQTHASH